MRQLRATLGLLILFLLAMSACTGDPTATATLTPTLGATATATPGPTVTPTAVQELRANLQAEPSSLDPQLASLAHDISVIRQLLQGLLGFKPDLSLEPIVAAEVPSLGNGGISPDGLTYTFKIREDVTWSDGKPVTAGDFVYSIKRLLDPKLGSRNAGLYLGIKGAMAYLTAENADAQTLERLRDGVAVVAPDLRTLSITLTAPDATFLHKMALPPAYPARQDIVEQAGQSWTEAGNYIGNGPFILAEWVHQDHITLEANPNYWGAKPKLSKISFRMIADVNAELAAYLNDELDLSQVPPGTEKATLADSTLGNEVIRFSPLSTLALFFNTVEPPFDNLTVRRAFTMSLDREAWVDKVKNGVGQPATSWLPPGMPGHDPQLGSEHKFDAKKAKELLAGLDVPGSVTLTHFAAGDQPLMAQFIQAQIKENLGIDVELEPLDPPSWFQKVVGARQFQMTIVAFPADYPDPEAIMAPLFMTGGQQNIMGYSNTEFDAAAGQAVVELDPQKRLDLWKQAHEFVVADVPLHFSSTQRGSC